MDERPAQTDRLRNRERQLVDYYDRLADNYDSNRFGNSYGRYVDAQERRLLKRWLNQVRGGKVLDLACGSGRLLDLANCGLDASPAMVRIARQKHPEKDVRCGLAQDVAELRTPFDAIFCAHLFMHLQRPEIEAVLRSCHEQLRPDGLLIFDAPSAHRRKLTGFQSSADVRRCRRDDRNQVAAQRQSRHSVFSGSSPATRNPPAVSPTG